LQDEGINFDTHNLVKEVKAKSPASGDLAELLNEKPDGLEEGERL